MLENELFNISLVRVGVEKAEKLWKMQVEAFKGLYDKYRDTDTSPAAESIDKTIDRLNQDCTYYYFIEVSGKTVGAMRVVDEQINGKKKRISPIFIMPEYRNKGYAQKAIQLAEELHGSSDWELDTILQEKGNCYLYEKMGYRNTGKIKKVNDKMTLVFYKKD